MLLKPIPQAEESPKSLLSRYTEGNLFPSVRIALNVRREDSGSTTRLLFGELNEVKNFAVGVEKSIPVDLGEWFYGQVSGFTRKSAVIWSGCEVPYEFFIPVKARICPCCIRRKTIHQSADFSFFSSCPIHRVKLFDSCANCKKPISWKRGSILSCQSCSFPFERLTELPTNRLAEITLMDWVRSGRSEAVSQCLNFLKALRNYYSKEVFESGVLLEVAVQLQQGNTASLLDLLAPLYPAGILPNRLILAPLFLASDGDLAAIRDQLKPLLPGIYDESRLDRSVPTPQKNTLRLEEVEFALNIEGQTRRKLTGANFLKIADNKGSHLQITVESTLALFGVIDRATVKAEVPHDEKWTRLAHDLVNNLELLRQGKAVVSDTDWANGCWEIRIRVDQSSEVLREDGFLDFDGFAQLAKTYPDAIRRLVKSGFVKPDVDRQGKSGAKFSAEAVESFCEKYCFSSEIAQLVKKGRTIISAVLSSAGVEPVSGPKIDGALVPLYLRADLAGLDLNSLVEKKKFKSNAGRKKEGTVLYDRQTWISSREIGELLGFCPVELSAAVSQGHLSVGVPPGREGDNSRYFLRDSVFAFKEILSVAINTQDAYSQLGVSKAEFYKRFVGSGFVKLIKIGKRSWITRDDYLRVEQECRLYIGTDTASRLTGAPPKHFRNLLNTDRISKVSSMETITAGFFDLIRRQDVAIHAVMAPAQALKSATKISSDIVSLKLS